MGYHMIELSGMTWIRMASSDGDAAYGGEPAEPECHADRREHARQRRRRYGGEEVRDCSPVMRQRYHDHEEESHQYLGGEEGGQPGNAPAAGHQPAPHSVQPEDNQRTNDV